jgi:hypothetical protein
MHIPYSRLTRRTSAPYCLAGLEFLECFRVDLRKTRLVECDASRPYQTFVIALIFDGSASLARWKASQSAGVASCTAVQAKQCMSFFSPAAAGAASSVRADDQISESHEPRTLSLGDGLRQRHKTQLGL